MRGPVWSGAASWGLARKAGIDRPSHQSHFFLARSWDYISIPTPRLYLTAGPETLPLLARRRDWPEPRHILLAQLLDGPGGDSVEGEDSFPIRGHRTAGAARPAAVGAAAGVRPLSRLRRRILPLGSRLLPDGPLPRPSPPSARVLRDPGCLLDLGRPPGLGSMVRPA